MFIYIYMFLYVFICRHDFSTFWPVEARIRAFSIRFFACSMGQGSGTLWHQKIFLMLNLCSPKIELSVKFGIWWASQAIVKILRNLHFFAYSGDNKSFRHWIFCTKHKICVWKWFVKFFFRRGPQRLQNSIKCEISRKWDRRSIKICFQKNLEKNIFL